MIFDLILAHQYPKWYPNLYLGKISRIFGYPPNWKEPHGRWITNKIQSDPTQFHMFMLKNDDACVGLQALVSIKDSIQPIM